MHIYIYNFGRPCGFGPSLYVGLYTILPSPILHRVWQEKGDSVGGAYIAQWSCNNVAIE